jgi:hypothetical protein
MNAKAAFPGPCLGDLCLILLDSLWGRREVWICNGQNGERNPHCRASRIEMIANSAITSWRFRAAGSYQWTPSFPDRLNLFLVSAREIVGGAHPRSNCTAYGEGTDCSPRSPGSM